MRKMSPESIAAFKKLHDNTVRHLLKRLAGKWLTGNQLAYEELKEGLLIEDKVLQEQLDLMKEIGLIETRKRGFFNPSEVYSITDFGREVLLDTLPEDIENLTDLADFYMDFTLLSAVEEAVKESKPKNVDGLVAFVQQIFTEESEKETDLIYEQEFEDKPSKKIGAVIVGEDETLEECLEWIKQLYQKNVSLVYMLVDPVEISIGERLIKKAEQLDFYSCRYKIPHTEESKEEREVFSLKKL